MFSRQFLIYAENISPCSLCLHINHPKRMQNHRISIDPKQVITCSTRAFYMDVRETRENACPYQQTKLEDYPIS